MPPKQVGLTPLDPLPQGVSTPVGVGDRVAFPDIVENPASILEGSVEERFPNHPHAGKYGIVQVVGQEDGKVKLDLRVFDPFYDPNDPDNSDALEPIITRVTLEEIQ